MKKRLKKEIAKVVVSVLCLNTLGTLQGSTAFSTVSADEEQVENTYVALTRNEKAEEQIGYIDEGYGETIEGKYHIYRFDANAEEMESLGEEKGIYVSEDVSVTGCGDLSATYKKEQIKKEEKIESDRETNYSPEWDMELINKREDYNDKKSEAIDIAILDSGIDFSSDINVVDVKDFVDEGNELNIFSDITGHGTSIAGIIASSGETEAVEGINSNVNIYSARILDENNNAPISRVVDAIYWAIEKEVKIINISFGTTEDNEVLKKAVSDAVNKGILVVASAGNTGDKVLYPAAYDGVLSVGSVDSKGRISDFSADGKDVDVMAPGEEVKSVGAFNGSIIVTGTSISAPHVVGAASLLWAKDKSVSADFIKELIIESSNETNIKKSKKGIIDIDYAFEIYDDFKKVYEENKKSRREIKEEFENDNKLSKSSNEYVEGVWSYPGHQSAAEYAGKSWDYTSAQIKILKKGVVYPDQRFGGMETRDTFENPQWHTAYYEKYYNYISNYVCAGMLARKIKKGVKITKKNIIKPKDMDERCYFKMLDQVAGIKWTEELLANQRVTNQNKSLFVMGMALHVITDVYAHQAFMKNNEGKWHHIKHHKDFEDTCDNPVV